MGGGKVTGTFPEITGEYPSDADLDVLLALRAIYDVLLEIQNTVDAIQRNR